MPGAHSLFRRTAFAGEGKVADHWATICVLDMKPRILETPCAGVLGLCSITHSRDLYAVEEPYLSPVPSHYLTDANVKSMLETSGDENRLHAV